MARLILASASPRRREMLSALGIEYEAIATHVEELGEGADPEALVLENARRKALAGLELAGAEKGDTALGVDTEVVLEGRVLGKAANAEAARERLLALSGRTHEVLSGVVLRGVCDERSDNQTERRTPPAETRESGATPAPASFTAPFAERSGVAASRVTFNDLDAPMVDRYLASGEWRDRAGAYAIQGLGSLLVARVEGDFSNVVGLPLQLLLTVGPELFPGVSSGSAEAGQNPTSHNHP